MYYTTRQQARAKVQAREPFKTSNRQLFARWVSPNLYVVYSYSTHWPLFMWDGFKWFENEDGFSATTSRHRSYTHPHQPTELRSATWLRDFIAAEEARHFESLPPLWYVRWKDYDRRKSIELVERAYSDLVVECWERGYAYIRAADELGAYAIAMGKRQRKGKAA